MADGKVVIETDLDSSGIEKGLKESEKSLKSQAASLAAEYKKQGMNSSDAFKKAWSEIERSSKTASNNVTKDWENSSKNAAKDWETSSHNISNAIGKIGGLAAKGLKVAARAVTGVATALGGAAVAAIKVGSDFESQMSKVQAISGATGEDFEKLSEKAKEMGAKTKFSATESGQAMEYMAMAGWKTGDMLDGIEGIMNLAAASGEDLASTSDIVTDALTAFGLTAADSGHFADILAVASANANTNVRMMGETFKYVAPVAGALGFSAEDTAEAIGLMANAGIKGSQAGTSLRAIMNNLSGDIKICGDNIGKVTIATTNADGSMRELSDILADCRTAFSGLTESEQANVAQSLVGTEAMSGFLALMNAGEEDIDKLSSAIEDCDGAAEKMAETMQDNLKGAITILGSSLEGLGVEIYESMEKPLKKTVKSVTKSVGEITKAFKEGGIDKAVQQAGKEFAKLATEAAKGAPKMVSVAVSFIQSFASGIVENKGELLTAAGEITSALVNGLIDLLPPGMRAPVRQAVQAITESFTDGGLNNAVTAVDDLFTGVIDIVSELAEIALPLLTDAIDFAGEHFDELVPLIEAAAVAYLTYKTAMAGVEAATTLAAVAQNALNLAHSASPIGMVIGLLSGTAGLVALLGNLAGEEDEAARQTQIANEKLADQALKIEDMQRARENSVKEIETEYGYYQTLWEELQGIVDQNGKIKENYEERATFITSTLADALGIEIEITDGVIQKYGDLCTSIDQVIQKQKQKAILSVYEDSYTEAIKNQAEANSELSRTYSEYVTAQENAKQATENLDAATKTMTADQAAGSYEIYMLGQAQADANAELKAAETAYNNARVASDEYNNTIANFEAAWGAVETGSANAEAAILALTNGLIRATGENEAELSKQVDTFKTNYEEMKAAAEDGSSGVTQTMVDGARAMWLLSQIELEKGTANNVEKINQYQRELAEIFNTSPVPEAAEQSTKDTMEGVNSEIESADTKTPMKNKVEEMGEGAKEGAEAAKPVVEESFQDVVQSGADSMENVDTATPAAEKGNEAGQGIAEAAESQKAVVEAAGAELVEAILSGMSQSDATTLMTELGTKISTGLSEGITANQSLVTDAVTALTEAATTAVTDANISDTANSEGEKLTQSMQDAVSSGTPAVTNAVKTMCQNAENALKSANLPLKAKNEGTKLAQNMTQAITSVSPSVVNAVKTLCTNSENALKGAQLPTKFKTEATNAVKNFSDSIKSGTPAAVNASKSLATQTYNALKNANLGEKGKSEGSKLGKGVVSGIDSQKGVASSAGAALGNAAKSGLENVGLHSAGYNIGVQMCNGIASGISSSSWIASNAAANAARAAVSAAKAALEIHSPSRVFRDEVGKQIALGMAEGIQENTENVFSAILTLSEKLLKKAQTANKRSNYEEIGKSVVTSLENGIKSYSIRAVNAVTKLVDKQVDALSKQNPKMKAAYEKAGKEVISKYEKTLENAAEKAKASLVKQLDSLAEATQQKYDEIISLQESMGEKIKSYGDLFTIDKKGNLILESIQDDIGAIKKYGDNLEALKGKISEDLMSEITSMSLEDATAFSNALLNMSASELQAYNDQYSEKIKLASEISRKFYADSLKELQDNYSKKVSSIFEESKKTFMTAGADAIEALVGATNASFVKADFACMGESEGKKLGESMADAIKAQKKSVSSATKLLGNTAKEELEKAGLQENGYNIGAQFTEGIVAGILAKTNELTDAAKKVAEKVAEVTKAELDIHSPSGVGKDIGKMFDKGVGGGIEENIDLAEKASENLADRIRKSVNLSEVTQGFRKSMSMTIDNAASRITQDSHLERENSEKERNVDNSVHMVNNYHVPVASPSEVSRANREAARKMLGGVR